MQILFQMAERQLAGKDLLLFRGNGEATNETFSLVACLTSNDIAQTSSSVQTETKCGKVTLPGPQSVTVPFAFIPNLSPAAGKVAIETLQNDFKTGQVSNWKATTLKALATPGVAGEPIFTFRGFLSDLHWKSGTTDSFNGTSTIEVDYNGVHLAMSTGVVTPTSYNSVIVFTSSATPATVASVTGKAAAIDPNQKLEFNSIASPTGLPLSMHIKVSGVEEALFDTFADYAGTAFRYTDKVGVTHNGVFTDGIVSF